MKPYIFNFKKVVLASTFLFALCVCTAFNVQAKSSSSTHPLIKESLSMQIASHLVAEGDTLWFPVTPNPLNPDQLDIISTPNEELSTGCNPENEGDECAVQLDLTKVPTENRAQLNSMLANPTAYTIEDFTDIGADPLETAYHEIP